jgi:hypothetical protein
MEGSRKQSQHGENEDIDSESDTDLSPNLIFRIRVQPGDKSETSAVYVRWLYGFGHVLFESFYCMLMRELR